MPGSKSEQTYLFTAVQKQWFDINLNTFNFGLCSDQEMFYSALDY